MKFSQLTDAERDRVGICIEEAAHSMWAVLSGGHVEQCTASATSGQVSVYDLTDRHRPEVAYAGIWARARFDYGRTPPVAVVHDAVRTASPADREAMGAGGLPRHIENDLEYLMPRIRGLAAKLYRRGAVRNPDILVGLGVGRGVDLDMVRWALRQRIEPASIRPAEFAGRGAGA